MKRLIWLIILGFGWLGMKSLLEPGLWTGHDIWHQVARFYWYHQALSEGQFWPSWISNMANGFGYPLFLFSYSLEWWFGEVLIRLGVEILSALKLLFVLGYLGSAGSMFYLSWLITKNRWAAMLAAILYLWAPYHFLSIYVSASIGTVFGFWLLPLLLAGMYLLKIERRFEMGLVLVALGVAGLILSHLITFLFVLPLVGIWLIGLSLIEVGIEWPKFWGRVIVGFGLGIVLASFYLIPAMAYVHLTKAPSEPSFAQLYQTNLINFQQLLYSKWGYSPITSNVKDGEISMQLGIAQWLSLVVVLGGILKLGWRHRLSQWGVMLWVALAVMAYLMAEPSRWWWAIVTRYITLDYPFRLLLPLVLVGSLAGAIGYLMVPRGWRAGLVIGLLLVALFTNKNHIQVNQHTQIPVQLYVDSEVTTNSFDEYLPATSLGIPESRAIIQPPVATASSILASTRMLQFDLNLDKAASVSARQFGFIGQQLIVDGHAQAYDLDQRGLINFWLTAGLHRVLIEYQPTGLMEAAKWVSLVGVLVVLGLFWRIKQRRDET